LTGLKQQSCFGGRLARRLTALAGVLVLAACTPVPLDAPKLVTRAVIAPATASLQQSAGILSRGRHPAHSSLIPMVEGNEALGARLRIMEAAEHTIDLQYFLMKQDLAGALISQGMLDAADRGVRVRLLLDDIFTTVPDDTLALLDAHQNIEVRVFNPAMRPAPKMLGLLAEFPRVNRRMHNKSFTADGAVAIVGGRNIADEYYQIQTDSEFADFEVSIIGPAVRGIEETFDLFWNDGWSVPMERLNEAPSAAEVAAARTNLDLRLRDARQIYEKAVSNPHFQRLISGSEPIYDARIEVETDIPDKVKVPVRGGGPRILAEDLLNRMQNASHSVVLMTPYFVPEDYGAQLFQRLAERGVDVRIITNSVGSTNHSYVHAGYHRHRASLLASGVELFEIRSDALQAMGRLPADDERGLVMHTKLAVIDRDEIFVGSLNLDPRSVKLNTEGGIFIHSHQFGGFVHDEIDREIRNFTYRLSLADDGALRWHYDNPVSPSVTSQEPGATLFNQTIIGITGLLGLELQL